MEEREESMFQVGAALEHSSWLNLDRSFDAAPSDSGDGCLECRIRPAKQPSVCELSEKVAQLPGGWRPGNVKVFFGHHLQAEGFPTLKRPSIDTSKLA